MSELCLSELYVSEFCVSELGIMCVSELYVLSCVEAEEGGEEEEDEEEDADGNDSQKTITPHNDVGKNEKGPTKSVGSILTLVTKWVSSFQIF